MENNTQILTDQKYWTDYYGTRKVDTKSVVSICSQFDCYWEKAISMVDPPIRDVVEIGGFPGRYLAYLAWKYNLSPASIDFNSNTKQIEEHFRAFGIDDYSILTENFLEFEPTKKYDLVLSNGFVEHFENHELVLDGHVKYMKEGGVLIVIIPNMRGLIRPYKKLLDRQNLSKHCLDSMKLSVFSRFAERSKLKLICAEYFGDFPFQVHDDLNGLKKHIQKACRILFKYGLNRTIRRYPNPYLSSIIVAILKK
jgi:SAM-dependent methyltransferase